MATTTLTAQTLLSTGELSSAANLTFVNERVSLSLTSTQRGSESSLVRLMIRDGDGRIVRSERIEGSDTQRLVLDSSSFSDDETPTAVVECLSGEALVVLLAEVGTSAVVPGDSSSNPAEFTSVTSTGAVSAGSLTVDGPVVNKRVATAIDYNVLATDYYVGVTNVAVTRTITLPLLSAVTEGQTFVVKDESGAAGIANPIVVDGNGAELVDGAADVRVSTPYGSVTVVSNGTSWSVI